MAALAGATERVKFGMNAMVAIAARPARRREAVRDDRLPLRRAPAPGVRARPRRRAGVAAPPAATRASAGASPTRSSRSCAASGARRASPSRAATSATRTCRSRRGPCSSRSRSGSAATARPRCAARRASAPASSPGSSRRRSSRGVVAAIRRELARAGRRIDPDHYGVTLPFRFGSLDDPAVQRIAAARGAQRGATARTGSRSATPPRSGARSRRTSTSASRSS